MSVELGAVLKAAYPEVVATLSRSLGDIDRAQDATQDAIEKALQQWQVNGVPRHPVAWLVTVGRNKAIDHLRRDARSTSIDGNVVQLLPDSLIVTPSLDDASVSDIGDDMLRLMFTCCHPELTPSTQIMLMLKVVVDFSVDDISRSLLVNRASVQKRLTRAKATLRAAQADYTVPSRAEQAQRIDAVLKAIYLLFNEGYTLIQDTGLVRSSILDQAIRLGRMVSRLFRSDPEPRCLLALMLLSAARLPGRLDERGRFVPLLEQNRERWNQEQIAEGIALVDAVHVARHPPGSYQIQAAISALHSTAPSANQVDWGQIVALYQKLGEYDASPVIPVNHAAALSYAGNHDAALALLLNVQESNALNAYQPLFATLGHVYAQIGDCVAARRAWERALELSDSRVQSDHIRTILASLD